MRCDVNISVRPKGQGQMGERTEIKNMNSISYLIKAVEYEFQRQVELLERGGRISRETRRYDQKTGTTQLMRKKEDQTDYLYFEEPDIPPVVLSAQEVEEWGRELPELPMQKRKRYQEQGLSPQETAALVKYPKVCLLYTSFSTWRAIMQTLMSPVSSAVKGTDSANRRAYLTRISLRERKPWKSLPAIVESSVRSSAAFHWKEPR